MILRNYKSIYYTLRMTLIKGSCKRDLCKKIEDFIIRLPVVNHFYKIKVSVGKDKREEFRRG